MAIDSDTISALADSLDDRKPNWEHDNDGVYYDWRTVNRWQKYGKDRLYFHDHEGYIDLEDGSVQDGAPVNSVEVDGEKNEAVYKMAADQHEMEIARRPL